MINLLVKAPAHAVPYFSDVVFKYLIPTYYEALILKLIVKSPDLVHLRWYEKDLVADYYIQAATFEDEQVVLQMINEVD